MDKNQKKLHKQKKREKKKRIAKEHKPTLETNFTEKDKKIGKVQIGVVIGLMVMASAFIFSRM